jgi:Zn-dependent protease
MIRCEPRADHAAAGHGLGETMRDPMSWAVPLYTLFGVRVRLHVLFPVVALGLVLRQLAMKEKTLWAGEVLLRDNPVPWPEVVGLAVGLLFAVALLHEYGHCLAARLAGGDPREVLLWPLGGLATGELPAVPRAHLIAAAGGPLVNVALCLALGAALAGGGYVPNLNPLANPYVAEVRNYRTNRAETSQYGANLYRPGAVEKEKVPADLHEKFGKPDEFRDGVTKAGLEWAVAPPWVTWAQRAFWLSWVVLLLNLLPAYPLDGGLLLHAVLWPRSGRRPAAVTVAYTGFVACLLLLVFTLAAGDPLLLLLAGVIYLASAGRVQQAEADEGSFGYDFSQGYTSLERDDDEPPPPARQPGLLARWRLARRARRMQEMEAERRRDEARMDELLDKIARKEPLTEEEDRFLRRVSERYRNRS